jgi:hypothetical protein
MVKYVYHATTKGGLAMNGILSGRRMVPVIILSTVIGFFIWLSCLLVLWLVLNSMGLQVDYWAMTEALSAAVTVAAVIGGGIIAYRELTEAASDRHVQIADALFSELNSQENINARRWIYQQLPKVPAEGGLDTLPTDGHEHVKRTLNCLDHVAFLTEHEWIPEETIMPWMNPMIVKSWNWLGPWVDHESEIRNEPDFYKSARQLAKRSIEWRRKEMPGIESHNLARDAKGRPRPASAAQDDRT